MNSITTVAIGYVIYKSDLSILRKSFICLKQQSFRQLNVRISLGVIDNDNGYQIEQIIALAKDLDLDIDISLSSKNIGFGAGHNRLFNEFMESALINYYLCINPDGIPHHEMLENFLVFAKSKSNSGIFEARQFPLEHPKVYDPVTFETTWCSGCCLLFPENIFKDLRGFDELFFLYCEDVDLSWRLQLLGHKCFTVPNAFFHHYVFSESRNLLNENYQLNISMYKLAVKYGNEKAVNQYLSILKELLNDKEFDNLMLDTKNINPIKIEQENNYITFEYAGYFGKNRW